MSGNLTSFSDLPEETKLHIFTHIPWKDILSSVSRVSKEIRTISRRSVEHLDFTFSLQRTDVINPTHLVTLFSPGLRSVVCGRPYTSSQRLASSVPIVVHTLRSCKKLKELTISNNDKAESPELFRALEEDEHNRSPLHTLTLVNFDLGSSPWSLANLRSLKHLHLRINRGLSDDLLAEIGQQCRRLESFSYTKEYIYFVIHDSEEPRFQFTDQGMVAFLEGVGKTLKKLTLYCSPLLTDASFLSLAQNCQQMEELQIHGAWLLKADALGSITRLRRLRVLRLTAPCHPKGRRYRIHNRSTYQFVYQLCASNQRLSDRDYERAFAGKMLGDLKTLKLVGMDGLGDAGLAAVAESCPALRVLQMLSRGNESPVTDYGVRALVENCGQLREVQIKCERVTGSAFENVGDLLPHLKLLDFPKMERQFAEDLKSRGIIASPHLPHN